MTPDEADDRTVAVLVIPMEDAAWIVRICALVEACGISAADTILIAERSRGEPRAIQAGTRHTTLLVESVATDRFGVVERAPTTSDEALIACCFYHRWMDAKRRAAVDLAVQSGCGVIMIVLRTIHMAAQLAREILQRVDTPLQLHELVPTWMAGAQPAPSR